MPGPRPETELLGKSWKTVNQVFRLSVIVVVVVVAVVTVDTSVVEVVSVVVGAVNCVVVVVMTSVEIDGVTIQERASEIKELWKATRTSH